MAQTLINNALYVNGAITVVGAISSTVGMARSTLTEDSLATYTVPLTNMRVHDAVATLLPTAAANDDMGLVSGTFATDIPSLQGVDFGGTATDEKCRFFFALPIEYVTAGTATLRCSAGILTTLADASLTLDCEAYISDREGDVVVGDLYAGAALDINSLTLGDKDFSLTATNLNAGDLLDIRLSFAGSDAGDLGTMAAIIAQVEMLLDVKG